jgi:glycogen debranching enzyme
VRTFAQYVRDGLIPNMFPDGSNEGVYHTADATLWFFHAVDRYARVTGDRTTVRQLLPVLEGVARAHLAGRTTASASTPPTGCSRRAPRATSSRGWTPRWATGW